MKVNINQPMIPTDMVKVKEYLKGKLMELQRKIKGYLKWNVKGEIGESKNLNLGADNEIVQKIKKMGVDSNELLNNKKNKNKND